MFRHWIGVLARTIVLSAIVGGSAHAGVAGATVTTREWPHEIHEVTERHEYRAKMDESWTSIESTYRRFAPPLAAPDRENDDDRLERARRVCAVPDAFAPLLPMLSPQRPVVDRERAQRTLIAEAERLRVEDPAQAAAMYNQIGTVLVDQGDFVSRELALRMFRAAIDVGGDARAEMLARRMLGQRTEDSEARGHWSRIIELTDAMPPQALREVGHEREIALRESAWVERRAGRLDAAIALRDQLLHEAHASPAMLVEPPACAQLRIENARDYAALGRIQEALREYDSVLEEHPSYAEYGASVFLRYERMQARGLGLTDPERLAELEAIWNDAALSAQHPVEISTIGMGLAHALRSLHISGAVPGGAPDAIAGTHRAVSIFGEVADFYAANWSRISDEDKLRLSLHQRFLDALDRQGAWFQTTGNQDGLQHVAEHMKKFFPDSNELQRLQQMLDKDAAKE